MLKSFTKEEKSWIMYDWANSAFATIMLAAVFPAFFVSFAGGEGTPGSMWWGIGVATSRFVLGLCAPFIGALISFKSFKKRLMTAFIVLGVIANLTIAFLGTWQLLLIGYILANMLWSASNFIYDSYLPDVTTEDRMDKVSAWGFAIGYIGGSTIPFIISIILILFGENFGVDAELAVRISVAITAIWWAVFSLPLLKHVHHKYEKEKPKKQLFRNTFKVTLATGKKIVSNRAVFLFIIAYFFYIDGVGTVINMAVAYGAELGLGMEGMIGALFLTQIVAFPCSILFGRMAKRFSSLNVIIGAVIIYIFIAALGFVMGFGYEEYWFDVNTAQILFWVLAFMVGTVQGGIQAISRSTYGRLIPKEDSGEYFGFYEIFGRFAAILGPGIYALVLATTGRASFSILSVTIIFVIGLTLLLIGRKDLAPKLR